MSHILRATLLLLLLCAPVAGEESRTALLIIDIQEFYFPGGAMPLVDPEPAAANAGRLLAHFRERGLPVVHVGHQVQRGGDFHADVRPLDGETVFMKQEVSAFHGTGLLEHLRGAGIERLVICGMQTHMCLEAATRAAYDLGFTPVVVADACATRDLEYGGRTIVAADVHASTLATLTAYAELVDAEAYLSTP